MGASFTNYQIWNKSSAAVKKALATLIQSPAYVSPEKDGWVTVYEETTDWQDQGILIRIAGSLSKALDTDVLGFLVHDSDMALYWLYRGGELIDEFNSAPDCFGTEVDDATRNRLRGNADALLPLCVAGTTREEIEEIIHSADGPPTFAEDILTDLAKVLGIDDDRMALGYKYFHEDGTGMLPDAAEFESLGLPTKRKKARAPKPAAKADVLIFDMFPVAVAMLTKSWTDEAEKAMEAHAKAFPHMFTDAVCKDTVKKLRSGFDRGARDFLKQSQLPGCPTIEELKAARDQGPEALAELLVKRTPTQLGSIAGGAVGDGLENFVAALLAAGLDPQATDHHGQTVLTVAEREGANSKIYLMLKVAAEKKS